MFQFTLTHSGSALILPSRVYGIAATLAVATIALAHVFLGESLSVSQAAGAALVLGGVLVISVRRR